MLERGKGKIMNYVFASFQFKHLTINTRDGTNLVCHLFISIKNENDYKKRSVIHSLGFIYIL